jgi:hypothetical protein
MKWQDRKQTSNIIDTVNDPIMKLMLDEMLMYTAPPQTRYRQVPWVEGQIEAIQNIPDWGHPRDERYHSPGGYLRRYGSSSDIMITGGPNGEIVENPHFNKPLVPHTNPEQRRNKAHDSE